MATYYVAITGNDANPGSSVSPWLTLSHAAASVAAGDTVIIKDGTYGKEGQVSPSYVVTMTASGSAGNVITFKAENRGGAILDSEDTGGVSADGAAAYFNLVSTSYVEIQGFKIKRGRLEGIHSNDAAHHYTIKWNEIFEIANHTVVGGPGLDGIYLNPACHHFTFDGNLFHDIGRLNSTNNDHGIYSSADDVTIINNISYNINRGWPIQLAQSSSNVLIANNTFYGPTSGGGDGQIMLWSDNTGGGTALSGITIQNNIFYQPTNYALARFECTFSGTNNVDHNIIYGTTGVISDATGLTVGSNQLNTNPLLANAGALDFRLTASSPAIGAGIYLANVVIDYAGSTRSLSLNDIGAYIWPGSIPTRGATPKWVATLASGQNNSHSIVYLNGYVYLLLETTPAQVIKINVTSPHNKTSASFASDGLHDDGIVLVYVPSKGKFYALFQSDVQLQITEVDPVTLAMTDRISTTSYHPNRGGMTTDDTYLYVGTRASPFKFIRISLTDWSTSDLNQPYSGGTHCIRYDSSNGKLYASNWSASGAFTRIDAATFTIDDTQGGGAFFTHEMGFTTNYFWLGSESASLGNKVYRVKKSDLTDVAEIDTVRSNPCWGVREAGSYVYACYADSAQVARINPWDLTFVDFEFNGFGDCNDLISNGSDGYFVFNTQPDKVAAVTLPSMRGRSKRISYQLGNPGIRSN